MIKFCCKNCGQKFTVSDQQAGKKGKCPKCKQTIVIPPAAQESAQKSSIIKFRCPSCNQKIGVAADYAGKRVRCAKCKNPMLVPQLSIQAGPSAVQDQTEVLRAGHKLPPAEEDSRQDMSDLDAQMFADDFPVEIPEEPGPDDYGTDESQLPEDSGSFPGQATEEQAGTSRKIIYIVAACVVGLVLLGIVVSFILTGSDFTSPPKFIIGFAILVALLVGILIIVSFWIVYEKAGYRGWASIVPFYNMWVLAEIGGKPGWVGLLMCFTGFIPIPYVGSIVGYVLSLIISIGVAKTFDRGVAFGIGLWLLPFVFFPILAFSRD